MDCFKSKKRRKEYRALVFFIAGLTSLVFMLSFVHAGENFCSVNSDCGIAGLIGNEYCVGNDVYKDFKNFNCVNNSCQSSVTPQLIKQCNNDSWFEISENFCKNGDVYKSRTGIKDSCKKIGDKEIAGCVGELVSEEILVQDCLQGCDSGECIPVNITCFFNSDCGTDRFIGGPFCQNNNVFQNFLSFKCNNPGTKNSYCSNSTTSKLINNCTINQVCSNGQCVNINVTIICDSNSDCGVNGFIGEKYCKSHDVYRDYKKFLCINPGTVNSYCSNEIIEKLVDECRDGCEDGECEQKEDRDKVGEDYRINESKVGYYYERANYSFLETIPTPQKITASELKAKPVSGISTIFLIILIILIIILLVLIIVFSLAR